jgi:hypothetical protein
MKEATGRDWTFARSAALGIAKAVGVSVERCIGMYPYVALHEGTAINYGTCETRAALGAAVIMLGKATCSCGKGSDCSTPNRSPHEPLSAGSLRTMLIELGDRFIARADATRSLEADERAQLKRLQEKYGAR